MKPKKNPSLFATTIVEHCDVQAKEIAKGLVEELYRSKMTKEKREDFLAFMLSDELMQFFYKTMQMLLDDPDGIKRIRSWTGARAGRISGAKRWNDSRKLKFMQWALEQNKRNPSLSKNAIAQMYAKDNPGESVATLRRYLSMIPSGSDGVD